MSPTKSTPNTSTTRKLRRALLRIPTTAFAALTRVSPDAVGDALNSRWSGLDAKDRMRLREQLVHRLPMDYAGSPLTLEVTSPQELTRLRSCSKEPWTVAWIENWVEPGDVLFDVGANVGAYALIAARHTEGQARVFAFEPAFANYAALCRNIVANGCEQSITPLPVALGAKTEFVRFRYRMLAAGAALHSMGDRLPGVKSDGSVGEIAYEQTMLGYRLDDFIATFGLPWPQHIKLDVDGAEFEVLAGAARALAHPKLRSVLIEMGPQPAESEPLVEILTRSGMELAESFEPDKVGRPAYGLFVPRTAVTLPMVRPSDAAPLRRAA